MQVTACKNGHVCEVGSSTTSDWEITELGVETHQV